MTTDAGRPKAAPAALHEAPAALREVQQLVRALVTAPTGVRPALEGRPGVPGWLDAWPEPRAALASSVRGDERLSAEARLDVYAQGYFLRLHEVLEGDYETVAWICGEAAFNDLVTAFLVAHPSSSPSLRDLGGPFASFLAEHPVAAFARERWPGLDDVATLEWAFADVFDAPDAAALARADVEAIPPERWAEIPLTTVPAFALLAFTWPVGEAVSARRRGDETPPANSDESQTLVVWRDGERAVFRAIEALEAEALERVATGETFGDLCAWLSERAGGEGEAAARAAGWLAGWLEVGWLAALPETFSLS